MKIPEEKIITAIANCKVMDFAEFGKGNSLNTIRKAEEKLGLIFPPSYKWWLENYLGGNLGSYEIFGLYEDYHQQAENNDIAYPGDIIYNFFINLKNKDDFFSKGRIELLNFEGDEIYYFDTKNSVNGEWSVRVIEYSYDENDSELYADDFSEFLYKLADSYG